MQKNYTLFSDSIGKGTIYDGEKIKFIKQNVPYFLEQKLNIQINNKSQYGQTLKRATEKGLFDNYVKNLSPTTENVAIICLGGNDADFNWIEISKTPYDKHESKTPLAEFSNILQNVILKLKNSGVKVILSTIMPINSELFFENVIGKMTDKKEVLKFLRNDLTNIHRVQECYNSEIIKIAYKFNCPLLDVRSKMLQTGNALDYFCKDGIHPNEQGYEFLAELYLEEINQLKNNQKTLSITSPIPFTKNVSKNIEITKACI